MSFIISSAHFFSSLTDDIIFFIFPRAKRSCLLWGYCSSSLTNAQVFTWAANASCLFLDDIPPPVKVPGSLSISGVRAYLPAADPPFPTSKFLSATINATAHLGVNGDEFPCTWSADGNQYTGAGDNIQPSPGINQSYSSPASYFRVSGKPTDQSYPDHAFTLMGSGFPISKDARALADCVGWAAGVANIKSSGVIEVAGTQYWAVSCFNYGDDPDFNRQRYGPAWIVASNDSGQTWHDAGHTTPVFAGRFAAPRFVQAGQANTAAPDGYVYVYFPGIEGDAAFFECNDAIWLGRVPAESILEPSAYEYFMGLDADQQPGWTSDASLAEAVFVFPLHTSVQQANYHPALRRYIFANWVWVSMDGNPRPDHSPDQRNDRTARQRTQLTLFEAPTPWGPFSLFYRDDNWQYSDGSMGAYTPVFPPAWLSETEIWMVSTQCCGNPQYPPTNHYSFNAQQISITLL